MGKSIGNALHTRRYTLYIDTHFTGLMIGYGCIFFGVRNANTITSIYQIRLSRWVIGHLLVGSQNMGYKYTHSKPLFTPSIMVYGIECNIVSMRIEHVI